MITYFYYEGQWYWLVVDKDDQAHVPIVIARPIVVLS